MRFEHSLQFTIVVSLGLYAVACFAGDTLKTAQKYTKTEINWSYDNDATGQEDWGYLPNSKLCEFGTNQSPINIADTKIVTAKPLKFSYNKLESKIKEATIERLNVEIINGGNIKYNSDIYSLKSIKIHSPSEHTVKGQVYPLEIHFVNETPQGKILIVAVFAETTMQNLSLDSILKQIYNKNKQVFLLDASNLLPSSLNYYLYNGSITQPPCTENVQWLVMKTPIKISPAQLGEIGKIIGRNARLPQPIYMREVQEGTE